MRHSTFQSVLDVRDRDDFRDIVVRFTKRMGSDRVGAMMVLDHRDAPTEFVAVDNAPDGSERPLKTCDPHGSIR